METFFSAPVGRKLSPSVVNLAEIIEKQDWSKSELGRICDWPTELIAAIRISLSAPLPKVIFLGHNGLMVYNAAFARFAGNKHPSIMAQPVAEAWPELAPMFTHAHQLCKAGQTFSCEDEEMMLIRSESAEQVWLDMDFSPILSQEGHFLASFGLVHETTAKVRAEKALSIANTEFRTLADTMPQMVWAAEPNGYHYYYNARWYDFTGMPEGSTDGEEWNGMFHPEDQELAWARWNHSLETGEPYEIEYRLRHRSGQYHWTLGRAMPVRDAKGNILRWFGTCTDIHETKIAAEERELIAQELSHRIKNIFSVLNGLISLAARAEPQCIDFANKLRTRIQAMGVAHDYVRPHSIQSRPQQEDTSLHTLLHLLLDPFKHHAPLEISGDDFHVDSGAATPVSLFIHELATNASKYGGLSEKGQGLRVQTLRENDDMKIIWQEIASDTPQSTPTEGGFGSRLIALTISGQMNGQIARDWTTQGLKVEITVPLSSLTRSAGLEKVSG